MNTEYVEEIDVFFIVTVKRQSYLEQKWLLFLRENLVPFIETAGRILI
jgi:hypothetical protein